VKCNSYITDIRKMDYLDFHIHIHIYQIPSVGIWNKWAAVSNQTSGQQWTMEEVAC